MPETLLPSVAWTITCTPLSGQTPSRPFEKRFLPVERAAFAEITTRIDALLARSLHAHGATVEAVGENQRYLAHLPSGKRRIRTCKWYRIAFALRHATMGWPLDALAGSLCLKACDDGMAPRRPGWFPLPCFFLMAFGWMDALIICPPLKKSCLACL